MESRDVGNPQIPPCGFSTTTRGAIDRRKSYPSDTGDTLSRINLLSIITPNIIDFKVMAEEQRDEEPLELLTGENSTSLEHQPLPVDFVSPLPPSDGFQYCITCADKFSKWPETYPIANSSTAILARLSAVGNAPGFS
ncbi:hypothetical protein NPIL_434921 [Nephila pilipes]|uniref:Uncharacterized protein n=1 Tax=Nephila pilipes TaxID=299642 RepID=A0A8X6QTU4_NEPPI|nr:hypothetical protein NPIL_434921 [Nephila pilipes]